MLPSRTWRITSEKRDLASYVEYVIAIGYMLTNLTSLSRSVYKFAAMISIAISRSTSHHPIEP